MADGPNLYLYCLNDPVNYVDAWGLCKDNGFTQFNNWLNDKLGIDTEGKYFNSQLYWGHWTTSVVLNVKPLAVALIVAAVGPLPADVIAGASIVMASTTWTVHAYRQAWVSDNFEDPYMGPVIKVDKKKDWLYIE